jgi:glycerol-1-phosphate dehydrogenase [NAD(P)+]
MIAAGFGDILGKYTSAADWRLGALLWDEPYDEEIAQRMLRALQACVDNAAEIAQASETGITRLMEGLFETGLCMLDFGQTRPASGSEHHLSHFWEMKLLLEHRPAVLHGAKVGLGTVFAARRYEIVRSLSQEEVAQLLANASLPDHDTEIARIRQAYGLLAGMIIETQRPFLDMTDADFEAIKQRIIDNWDAIQEIAASVPPAQEIANLLEQVDGPTEPQQIGLNESETQQALDFAHYLRARFTVTKLGYLTKLF